MRQTSSRRRWFSAGTLFMCLVGCAGQTEPAVGLFALAATQGKQLALGKGHGCSLDAAISGVLCWGDNRKGQTDVPSLSSPTAIAAGGDTSCAIDRSGVKCWGDGERGQLRVPFASSAAKLLAVGEGHACAASERAGIECWGDDQLGQATAPALEGVTALGAGARHSCAIAADGVTCWGDNTRGQLDVPALTSPASLSVAADHTLRTGDLSTARR